MTGWGEYTAAWAIFLLSHTSLMRPPIKPWLVARLRPVGYVVAYSLASTLILIWLIVAAGRAPYIEVWPWAEWQPHVTQTAMVLAVLIVSLAAFRPNPLSFGGWHNDRYDPAKPGIVGLVRHPILAALGLWAAGHLVPNGDLAHVLMFGGFAGFAVLGMVLINRRRKAVLGPDEWHRLRPHLSIAGLWAPWRILAAIVLVAGLIAAHTTVIGVSPI